MAGHYLGILLMTGHIGTNTPKFVPPRWGQPRFDPTQTGQCKSGWAWSSLTKPIDGVPAEHYVQKLWEVLDMAVVHKMELGRISPCSQKALWIHRSLKLVAPMEPVALDMKD